MFEDKSLLMSDAQTGITATGASTSYIDSGAKGEALNSHAVWYCRVATSLTSGSSTATISAQLETADDTSFSTNKTVLIATGAIPVATAVAGYIFAKAMIPVGVRRYIRTNYVIAVESLTGGAFDSNIVSDVDVLIV